MKNLLWFFATLKNNYDLLKWDSDQYFKGYVNAFIGASPRTESPYD